MGSGSWWVRVKTEMNFFRNKIESLGKSGQMMMLSSEEDDLKNSRKNGTNPFLVTGIFESPNQS